MNELLLLITIALQPQLATDGWTVLTPSSDSRIVYVSSSSGLDANDGLSEAKPKKTITSAMKMLRDGSPDWLLLKSGDVWREQVRIDPTSGGDAPDRKTVITSYGDGPRPSIRNDKLWFGSSKKTLHNIAIVGIDFYASYSDPSSPEFGSGTADGMGMQLLPDLGAEDILIEDNSFRFQQTQLQIQTNFGVGPLANNIVVRRNQFTDARKFGLMMNWTSNVLVEENFFDRCGWEKRDSLLHDAYIKEGHDITVRGNIFSRGGNMGLKLAGNHVDSMLNFTIENNLVYRCMIGFGHSQPLDYDPFTQYSHQHGIVKNNVFLQVGKNLPWNATTVQAIGLNIGNVNDMQIDGNIFAHNNEILTGGQVFRFADPATELSANITASNNVVYDWLSTLYTKFGTYIEAKSAVTNLVEINNLPTDVTYTEPSRDIGTYNVTLGGSGDANEFLSHAAGVSKNNWNAAYTANAVNEYIRAGFAKATPTPEPSSLESDVHEILLILRGFQAARKGM